MHNTSPKINDRESNHLAFLESIRLFKDLPEETLLNFLEYSQFKKARKGSVLFLHKDKADLFYIIVRGWVKLFRETLNGDEAIIDILTDHHSFGEISIFGNNNTYAYTAQTIESSELITIPTSILRKEVENNQKFALNMISSLSASRKKQTKELEHLIVKNAPQRIGCFLLRFCVSKKDQNSIELYLPYDKILIAARLGMKPETFSRALSTLKNKTGIKVMGAAIVIENIEQLTDYCCSFCSESFPCEKF